MLQPKKKRVAQYKTAVSASGSDAGDGSSSVDFIQSVSTFIEATG